MKKIGFVVKINKKIVLSLIWRFLNEINFFNKLHEKNWFCGVKINKKFVLSLIWRFLMKLNFNNKNFYFSAAEKSLSRLRPCI